MTIHVGMEPYSGIISYYNGVENIINSGIKHVEKDHIRKASIMYEMLKLKADGKQLGCACVFLSENYDNEIRKRFIEEGFKVGFKIVEIINIATAIYLTTMSQINYNPLNGNILSDLCTTEKSITLSKADKIDFEFKIDENEIYSVFFKSADKNIKSPTPTMPTPTTYKKTSTAVKGVNENNKGETLLPSYVAYDEKNVKCGNVVVHRLRYFSKSTIFDSKRIIGRSLDDIEIDEKWPFILFYENNEVYMQIDAFNGKRKLKAEQIAADLLKHIKLKSEDFQGFPLNKVVITVPAAFTEAQKNATMEAAKLAGFKNIKLLPEPVAAAAAYFINRPMTKNPNVFLLDLGGGTLDICVFKVENDKIKVISNTGDSKLGSANFDTILINYFKSVLDSKYGISASKDKKYKLMLASQRIKEDLTSITNISLDVEEIDISKEGQIVISREEFERMAKPLLNKIRNTIQSALYISKYDANQIDKV
uniref:Heat shock protein 70 n=1 Tax=Panagrolaimus davidi TaxID=227884 RepID=A0A914QAP6_9BILA